MMMIMMMMVMVLVLVVMMMTKVVHETVKPMSETEVGDPVLY